MKYLIVFAAVAVAVVVHASPKPSGGLIVSPGYGYASYTPGAVITGASAAAYVSPGVGYAYGYPGYAALAGYGPYGLRLGYKYPSYGAYPYGGYGYAKYYY